MLSINRVFHEFFSCHLVNFVVKKIICLFCVFGLQPHVFQFQT